MFTNYRKEEVKSDLRNLRVELYAITDLIGEDDAELIVSISEKGNYLIEFFILETEFSYEWFDNLLRSLTLSPNYWNDTFEKIRVESEHKKDIVTINGESVEVDKDISSAILELNKKGFKTKFCCQGGGNCSGYIFSETLPAELCQVAELAGMMVHDEGCSIYCLSPPHHYNDSAKAFTLMLNDWKDAKLDMSGSRYNYKQDGWRSSVPLLPE